MGVAVCDGVVPMCVRVWLASGVGPGVGVLVVLIVDMSVFMLEHGVRMNVAVLLSEERHHTES